MRAAQGLALITALAAERDLEKAVDAYLSAIRIFGFDCCAAGAWTGVGRGARPSLLLQFLAG